MVGLKVERLKPGMENYPEQLLFSYQASQAAQWSRIHLPMQDMCLTDEGCCGVGGASQYSAGFGAMEDTNIVLLSISFFMSFSVCLMYLGAPMLGA